MSGQFDDIEPVSAHLGGGVARQIAARYVQPGGLGIAGRKQTALQYQRAFVLPPVEAGVVDTDGGARREFHGEGAVPLPEGLAALGPGELGESHHGVVRDHRHGEGGLDEAAGTAGHRLDPAGTQGVGARGVEGIPVDGAGRRRLDRASARQVGSEQGRVGDGAGDGDPSQGGAATAGIGAGGAAASRRGLLPGEQPLVEVDGREVAEAGDGNVEEFPGSGLQVEGVAYPGARLVEDREIAAGARGLACGDLTTCDVTAETGDPDRTAGSAEDAVQVDGPMAAFLAARGDADDLDVGGGFAGRQDPLEGGVQPVRLGAGEIVVDRAAPVLVRRAAEDGGEALVRPLDGEVRAEQHEAEGRLTENRLRRGEFRFDPAQCADVHDDAERGPFAALRLAGHHIDLGEAVHATFAGHLERDEPGPLLAVEDLRDLAVPTGTEVGGYEHLHRVLAPDLVRSDSEQLSGSQTPLVDQPVGPDREGSDLYVVIDRARRTALPHDVVRRSRYLAHATVPSSSRTGPAIPAVFSTTALTGTAFTITAQSRSF